MTAPKKDRSRYQIDLSPEAIAAYRARFRELREAAGLSTYDVAAAWGMGQSAYQSYEGGDKRIRALHLRALAQLYGMPLEKAFPMAQPKKGGRRGRR